MSSDNGSADLRLANRVAHDIDGGLGLIDGGGDRGGDAAAWGEENLNVRRGGHRRGGREGEDGQII